MCSRISGQSRGTVSVAGAANEPDGCRQTLGQVRDGIASSCCPQGLDLDCLRQMSGVGQVTDASEDPSVPNQSYNRRLLASSICELPLRLSASAL